MSKEDWIAEVENVMQAYVDERLSLKEATKALKVLGMRDEDIRLEFASCEPARAEVEG